MTLSVDKQFYLTESLQQHPSAFIVFDKDLRIQWMNNSSRYIFNAENDNEVQIKGVFNVTKSKKLHDIKVASSFESNVDMKLRKINFFLRSRVHEVPLEDKSSFYLLEVLTNNKDSLEENHIHNISGDCVIPKIVAD